MVTLMIQRSSISQIVLLVVMMKLLKTEHLEPVDSPQTTNDSVSSDPCTHFLAQGIRATRRLGWYRLDREVLELQQMRHRIIDQ
jgi:hypothetical protein